MDGGEKPAAWACVARVGAALGCLALAHCSVSDKLLSRVDPRYGVASSPRVVKPGKPVPKGGGVYRIGKPYTIRNKRYVPRENKSYRAVGVASWYGRRFHGRRTANGEIFDMHSMSAAHPTLPLPSYVRVTNLRNRRSVILRVNDRGPFHGNRIIDVSIKAADLLGFSKRGIAKVQVEYVGRASLKGSDDGILMATLRTGRPAPAPSLVRVAATRPFVPAVRRVRPRRGPVPVPPDRPFRLGAIY